MAGIIEIKDLNERGALAPNLCDLLTFLQDKVENLVWSILDLEAIGDPEKLKTDLLEIERQAQESPHGLILRWEDLVALAEALVDVWNILIAAVPEPLSIPRLEYGTEEFGHCEIAIECFDSSFWRVYARDDATIHKLEGSFRDVRVTQL